MLERSMVHFAVDADGARINRKLHGNPHFQPGNDIRAPKPDLDFWYTHLDVVLEIISLPVNSVVNTILQKDDVNVTKQEELWMKEICLGHDLVQIKSVQIMDCQPGEHKKVEVTPFIMYNILKYLSGMAGFGLCNFYDERTFLHTKSVPVIELESREPHTTYTPIPWGVHPYLYKFDAVGSTWGPVTGTISKDGTVNYDIKIPLPDLENIAMVLTPNELSVMPQQRNPTDKWDFKTRSWKDGRDPITVRCKTKKDTLHELGKLRWCTEEELSTLFGTRGNHGKVVAVAQSDYEKFMNDVHDHYVDLIERTNHLIDVFPDDNIHTLGQVLMWLINDPLGFVPKLHDCYYKDVPYISTNPVLKRHAELFGKQDVVYCSTLQAAVVDILLSYLEENIDAVTDSAKLSTKFLRLLGSNMLEKFDQNAAMYDPRTGAIYRPTDTDLFPTPVQFPDPRQNLYPSGITHPFGEYTDLSNRRSVYGTAGDENGPFGTRGKR